MGKPDALSRRSDHGTGADDNSDIVLLTLKLFAVRALEGLQFTGPEQDILRDIRHGTKQPKEEAVARAAQDLRKSSTRSLQSAEWSERDGLLYYRGSIYTVPDTSDLRHRIVSLCHDTKVAGHPGVRGTPSASDAHSSSASASDSRLPSASAPATSSLFRNAFGRMTSYATRSRSHGVA